MEGTQMVMPLFDRRFAYELNRMKDGAKTARKYAGWVNRQRRPWKYDHWIKQAEEYEAAVKQMESMLAIPEGYYTSFF